MSVCSRWGYKLAKAHWRPGPRALVNFSARAYATHSTSISKEPKDVAILGGGITGLSAAYSLLLQHPNPSSLRITIYDSKPNLGGWIKSDFVDVPGGKILFERGPHTLRPAGTNGMFTLFLTHQLGLENELLTCSKDSPAAKNRYVYYPDHLVRMPSALGDIPGFLQEPLAEGLVEGVIKEFLNPWTQQSSKTTDYTVAEIISERMHPKVANLVSAVLHGIYAGDVENLSFGAVLPGLDYYMRRHGSFIRGALHDMWHKVRQDTVFLNEDDISMTQWLKGVWINEISDRIAAENEKSESSLEALRGAQKSSVYSFKNGLQQLPLKLEEYIRGRQNVIIKTSSAITSLEMKTKGPPHVVLHALEYGDKGRKFTHVISTIPNRTLSGLLGSEKEASGGPDHFSKDWSLKTGLNANSNVNVMVVNLWYATPELVPVKGFGYLIPKDIPVEQNPEMGLGVIFVSDAIQGQDTVQGTKLTVMLGGHMWNDWPEHHLPSETEGVGRAKSLVARHLGITEEPVVAQANLHRNCIPQYGKTYPTTLSRMHDVLAGNDFKNRLILAGSSYDGVGVNDCVRSGFEAGLGVVAGFPGLARRRASQYPIIGVPAKDLKWVI